MSSLTLGSVRGNWPPGSTSAGAVHKGSAESLVIEEWGWGFRGELAQAKKVVNPPLRRVGLRAWCLPCENSPGLGKAQSQLMGTQALAVSHNGVSLGL